MSLARKTGGGATANRSITSQSSELNFASAVSYSSGGDIAASVAVADLNGDGKPDLVVANGCADVFCGNDGTVGVLLGNGDGTFQPAITYKLGFGASSVAIADVNGDGKPDLVLADGGVSVMLGNGDGTFQAAVTYDSGGSEASSVAVADVNADGKQDLVVANQCASGDCSTGTVGVLLGNGDGTFQKAVSYDSGGYIAIWATIADVNGDGKPDLLLANLCYSSSCAADGEVGVLLGNGDGTFQAAVTYDSGGSEAFSVAATDVNADGKQDLVVAVIGAVSVLLGNGDGTFQKAVTYGSGGDWLCPGTVVEDVNGDGIADIAVPNDLSGSAGVLLGNGNGTFQPVMIYSSGGVYTESVAVADVNGDGKPDLLLANGYQCSTCTNGSASVLINTSLTATTTTLTSSANPSNFGQPVILTATVNPQLGFDKETPTGTVNFYNGTMNIGSSALNSSGVGSLTTSTLAIGTDSITVTYNGDSNFAASTSQELNQVVQGAIVQFSPTSINFGNQTLGISSTSQNVVLTNTGNVSLSITSISISLSNGSYSQTNTCGTSLAAGASCTASLTWIPGIAGNMTGSITFTDNASNSPQTVPISGNGVVPSVTLSPTSLTFATQVVFTTSGAQTVTLSNTGAGLFTISKISVSGQFTQTNNCGGSVASGGSCTISAKFKPTTSGTLTGSISITDNASGSPQKITLTGTGTDVQFTPTSLNFGNQPVDTKSSPKKITLSNKASVAVSITSISITGTNKGDFAETNTCGKTVKAGASCSITVTFTPAAKGKRTGNVSVNDTGGGSPQTVGLSGTGT